jgi:uncharacterized membrane protein
VSRAGLGEKIVAALAYFTFLPAVLFLLVGPYRWSPLVRFHAFQSVLFHIAWAVLGIALGVVAFTLASGIAVLVLWPLYGFASLLIWSLLVLKALREELFQLPGVGPIALRRIRG